MSCYDGIHTFHKILGAQKRDPETSATVQKPTGGLGCLTERLHLAGKITGLFSHKDRGRSIDCWLLGLLLDAVKTSYSNGYFSLSNDIHFII